ncbi:box C/D snoRNA protein 1 [Teleopsis dalmanni]|uniref:box C/D snoRNA protein 1 n=1 Tax=Teleopsis dalmanni TaxID=139649 RepID=UPI0018CFACD7|nr:box C/D snoRNA protein 1 [Teleopsis dalmanni]
MKRGLIENYVSSDSEDETTAENKIKSKRNRFGKCEVCAANDAIYSCPKCEVKTCCVRCVNIHKKELSCDGIRDRTKFIPLCNMTKMDFMSDYYFLEECTRYVEDRKHDPIKSITRFNKLPSFLYKLQCAANKRNIRLQFLLKNFTKHKENSTILNFQTQKINWHVEWVFVNASNLKFVDRRCPEDLPLHKLLDKYVNPDCITDVPRKKELIYYQSAGIFNLKILLKAEGIKQSRSRFYKLDVAKSLNDNLANKTIVEYPTIYISYEQNSDMFDVIDSDEDIEEETKAYQSSLEEFSKKIAEQTKKEISSSGSESEDSLKNAKQQKQAQMRRKEVTEVFEKEPSNLMFADEKLLDMLSTSSSSESEDDNVKENFNFP